MEIIFSDKHNLHNVGGRYLWKEGETAFSYWEREKINIAPGPGDDFESPARMLSIVDAISKSALGSITSPKDFGLDPILAVHNQDYIHFLKTIYAENAKLVGFSGPVFPETLAVRSVGRKPTGLRGLKGYYAFDVYTPIVEGTWDAAYWSVQCALTAADLVRSGSGIAYAACRPSGHHASSDLYGGFCFLNNAAVAARYLQEKSQTKVAILDIDFHHGNGTQAIFYSDPNVLFCSLHGDPEFAFPYYTGNIDETGEGAGQGFNHNWPLPFGTDDLLYLKNLEAAISVVRDFHPGYLVISAGFDIGAGDPYGGFNITRNGIHEIGKSISRLTQSIPTLVIQEGGYVPDLLGEYVVTFLQAFS